MYIGKYRASKFRRPLSECRGIMQTITDYLRSVLCKFQHSISLVSRIMLSFSTFFSFLSFSYLLLKCITVSEVDLLFWFLSLKCPPPFNTSLKMVYLTKPLTYTSNICTSKTASPSVTFQWSLWCNNIQRNEKHLHRLNSIVDYTTDFGLFYFFLELLHKKCLAQFI